VPALLSLLLLAAAGPPAGPAVPAPDRIAAARAVAAARPGVVSFAVIDSRGREHGLLARRRHVAASLVKAQLLVSYLRREALRRSELDAGERGLLGRMIRSSDNAAATVVYHRVRDRGLAVVGRLAAMTDLRLHGLWARTYFSARDQARFFVRLDKLLPGRFQGYARMLLRTIIPAHSCCIAREGRRRRWRVYFKGGLRTTRRGVLFHQAALLERGRRRVALAVLTDGNRSQGQGMATVAAVTRALLR
jgi:hypothetical protein